MKLAVVAKPEHVKFVAMSHLTYHLVLPHLLNNRTYRNYYQVMHEYGHFIMMDNGAAEANKLKWVAGGPEDDGSEMERPSFERVVALANELGVDEIVLPDKKLDRAWTVEHTVEYAGLVEPRRRAIVPQGQSYEEWIICYQELHARLHGEFRTICITKDYEGVVHGGRAALLDWLVNTTYGMYDVHLFGVHGSRTNSKRSIQDEVMGLARMFPWVRGIDTAAPLAFAQHDISIAEHRAHISYDWERQWINHKLAEENIEALRRWCNVT